jgi:predicted lipoprotein with Yx(FWY)xxD motif
MTSRLGIRWLAVPFAASLLLAACGDDDNEADTGNTSSTAASSGNSTTSTPATDSGSGGGDYGGPGGTSATTSATGGAAVVEIGGEGLDFGDILVDADGKTLYLYANDTEMNASTCNDQCAVAWPPFLADSAEAGDGVTGDVSVITRDDGDSQVAINGHPLYYFAGDAGPGEANGQGTLDVWHVSDPAGEPVSS